MRQWTEQDIWKGYKQPVSNRLNLRRRLHALAGQARGYLPFLRGEPRHRAVHGAPSGQEAAAEVPKKYQRPRLRQVKPEQARLILFGYATVGHPGAKALIDVIFSDERTGAGTKSEEWSESGE